jgi:hypothetical protein
VNEQLEHKKTITTRKVRHAGLLALILALCTLLIVAFIIIRKEQSGQASAQTIASSALSQASGAQSTVVSVQDKNAQISAALAALEQVCKFRPPPPQFVGSCAQASQAASATPITVTNANGVTVVAPVSPVTITPPPIRQIVVVSTTIPPGVVLVRLPGMTTTMTLKQSVPVTTTVTIEFRNVSSVVATTTLPGTTIVMPQSTVTQAPITITATLDPVTNTVTTTSSDTETSYVTVMKTVHDPTTIRNTETVTETVTTTENAPISVPVEPTA